MSRKRKSKAYSGIVNKAGNRDKLAMILFGLSGHKRMETPEQRLWIGNVLGASSDPMLKQLSRIILNPMPQDKLSSVSSLAENLGITSRQFTNGLKDLMRDEGFVRMAQHLPVVMEDVALDAMSHDLECSTCKGLGQVIKDEVAEACTKCAGKGTVRVLGDTDRLRLLFETFELIGKRGAGINIDLRRVEAAENLSDLSQSIAPILEG